MNALQRAVSGVSTDLQAAAVVEELFNKLENTKFDVDSLIRELFQNTCVRMRAVRAVISRLSKSPNAKRRDPEKASSYLRFASAIVDKKCHADHFSVDEWHEICEFLCSLQRTLDDGPSRQSIKLSTEVFRLLFQLLKQFEAIDDTCFTTVLDTIAAFPFLAEETSAHPHILGCIRLIYLLASHEIEETAKYSRELGISIIEMGPFRNLELKLEALALCRMLDDSNVPQIVIPKLLANMEQFLIPESDVEFCPATISWGGTSWFRARSFAPLAPFLASSSLAHLLSGNVYPDEKQSFLQAIDQRFALDQIMLQALCFVDFVLDATDVHYLLNLDLKSSEIYWMLNLISSKSQNLDVADLLAIWRTASERLTDQRCSSAAAYALAKCVTQLAQYSPIETDLVPLLISLLWQFNTSPTLSSGSLYLYRTIKELKIMDETLQSKLARLDNWLVSQVCSWLQSSDEIGYNLELLSAVTGETYTPIYSDRVTEMCQDLEWFRPMVHFNPPSGFSEPISALKDPLLCITPSNDKLLMWLSIVGTVSLSPGQHDYFRSLRFRNQMASFILYASAVGSTELASTIACMAADWPLEDEFDMLVHSAKMILAPAPLLVEDFLQHTEFPKSGDTLLFLGVKVLSEYSLQRNIRALLKIAHILETTFDHEVDSEFSKNWTDLRSFLTKLAPKQSKFSRLRPISAALHCHVDDLLANFNTSCDDIAVQIAKHIRLPRTIDQLGVELLERWLKVASGRSPLVIDTLISECTKNGADLSVLVEFCAFRELASSIQVIANEVKVPPRLLLFFTGAATFERWAVLHGELEFPYHLFHADPSQFFQMLPFPVLPRSSPTEFGVVYELITEMVSIPKVRTNKRKRDDFDLSSWTPFVLLKMVPLIRLSSQDWEQFPLPPQPLAKTDRYPEFIKPSWGSIEWVIEEVLRSVEILASPAQVYLAIRRCWSLYSYAGRPASVLKTFLRGAITNDNPSLYPVIEHLVSLCSAEMDSVLAAEIACTVSPELRQILKPHFDQFLKCESGAILSFLESPTPEVALSILEGDFPTLELEFPMYKSLLAKMEDCNTDGLLTSINPKRAEIIVSNLIDWVHKLGPQSSTWSSWAANFILSATNVDLDKVHQVIPKVPDDPMLAVVQTVYQHVRRHGYNVFRWLVPFLREFPVAKQLFPTIRAVLPKNYPRLKFPPTAMANNLEMQLGSIFDCYSRVPLHLAHYFLPELAGELLPFLYQELLDSDPSSALSLMCSLESLVPAFPDCKSVIVRAYCRAYINSSIPTNQLQKLVTYARDLNMNTEALMFAELLGESKRCEDTVFAEIFKGLDDPDIQSSIPPASTLEFATANMDSWQSLQIGISRFEVDQTSGAGVLSHSFRDAGLFRLANMIQKPSLYDYESAWKLQQWDLPAPRVCQSEPEILFDLFKDIGAGFLDFERAKKNAFELACTSDLSALKTIQEILCVVNSDDPKSGPIKENSRLGREILLAWRGDYMNQAKELSRTCAELRDAGDLSGCVSSTVKLEKLVTTLRNDGCMVESVGLLSLIESAQTSWRLGNQSSSIMMMKQAVAHVDFLAPDSRLLYEPCEVLCTLSNWTSEARSETDSTIEKSYLEPAVMHLTTSDVTTREFVYHTFAKFCDERYRDVGFIKEIKDAKRLVTNRDTRQKTIKEKLKTCTAKDRKYWETKYVRERSLLESEYRDYQSLMHKRLKFVSRALKMYIDSLAVGDKYTLNDSSRIVSLWLSNTNSNEVNDILGQALGRVPTFKWLSWLNQLTSCVGEEKSSFQRVLAKLIKEVCTDHPYHSVWYMQALTQGTPADARAMSRNTAGSRIWRELSSDEKLCQLFSSVKMFSSQAIQLSAERVAPDERLSFSFRKLSNRQGKWWRETLPTLNVPIPTKSLRVRPDCAYFDVPVFQVLESKIEVASGISAPKVVRATDSSGEINTMLFKDSKDDLRQDAIMEQVFGQSNAFLAKDREARKRNLSLRTYNVISLSPTSGVIEFVTNTKSFFDILDPLHRAHGEKNWTAKRARELMSKAYPKGKDARLEAFAEICEHIKPVFRFFFFEKFRDAESWLRARTAYSRSAAASSILGYILGLGDRHCSNILLDMVTGEVVHIDLGIAFDQGQALRIPETVPFRLSRDVIDGFGSAGYKGVFSRCAEITMNLLREQQDDVFTILDVLLYDPLYQWRLSPLRGNAVQDGTFNTRSTTNPAPEKPESDEAERALRGVRKKLSERLSSEAIVRQLIQQASSMENLALLFEGWAPFY